MIDKPEHQKQTKIDLLISALRPKPGATNEKLCKLTGWQPHSVRAALSGLRKKGFAIKRTTGSKGSVFSIGKEPTVSS